LLGVFGEAFGEIDTYQHSVPGDDYLTRLLAKQHFIAVVAMNGKEVGGGLAAYELDKFEQDLHLRSRRWTESSTEGRCYGVDR
jgi:aminoglycoside 3-N-acetyltransferase I